MGVVPPPATSGLRIGLIHSGSYVSEIFDLDKQKDKQFLVDLSIPALSSSESKEREECSPLLQRFSFK
jgi:hypothetical protein